MIFVKIVQLFSYYRSRIRGLLYNLYPGIHVGKGSLIEPGAKLSCQYGGSITIGDNCVIFRGGLLLTHGGDIVLGNQCTVNPYAVIYGQGGVTISNCVRIAAHCSIIPSNHIFDDPNQYIFQQGLSKKGIKIGEDVWLGSGVKVLDGVNIECGCVIGANSVVTKSTEPYGVYVGAPARLIRTRGETIK